MLLSDELLSSIPRSVIRRIMNDKYGMEIDDGKINTDSTKLKYVLTDAIMDQIRRFSYVGAATIEKGLSQKMKERLSDLGYRILSIETAPENKYCDRFIYSCAPYFIKVSEHQFDEMSAKNVATRIQKRINNEVSSMFENQVYPYRRLAEEGGKDSILVEFGGQSVDFKDEILRRLYREGFDVKVVGESICRIRMAISWIPRV